MLNYSITYWQQSDASRQWQGPAASPLASAGAGAALALDSPTRERIGTTSLTG